MLKLDRKYSANARTCFNAHLIILFTVFNYGDSLIALFKFKKKIKLIIA